MKGKTMFTASQIKARMKQAPFVPLRIVTSSGETYDVNHPEMVFVGTRDIQVGKASHYDPTIYSDVTRIALMHITALQDLPLPTPASGNGEPKGS
jgi:hypothetical protein